MLRFKGSILFVTHDRMFLRKLATRIIELDRGKLKSLPGDYDSYLMRKEAELAVEEAQREAFDKKLGQEEVWIRQGVKARHTRDEGRVKKLLHLWGRIRRLVAATADNAPSGTQKKPVDKPKREKPVAKRKHSFKEQRELEALPEQIEKAEAEHQDLLLRLSSPTFYRADTAAIAQVKTHYEEIERELPLSYARWQELEEIKGSSIII